MCPDLMKCLPKCIIEIYLLVCKKKYDGLMLYYMFVIFNHVYNGLVVEGYKSSVRNYMYYILLDNQGPHCGHRH